MRGIKYKGLRKGDLIVVRPDFSQPKLSIDWLVGWAIHKFCKATHIVAYTGKGYIIDNTKNHKVKGVRKTELTKFIEGQLKTYGGVTLYVVKPKRFSNRKRKKFVQKLEYYLNNNVITYSVSHLVRFAVWIYRHTLNKIAEPLTLTGFAVCSTFMAWVLKEIGTDIGRRASITFTPLTFLCSRKFVITNKVVII